MEDILSKYMAEGVRMKREMEAFQRQREEECKLEEERIRTENLEAYKAYFPEALHGYLVSDDGPYASPILRLPECVDIVAIPGVVVSRSEKAVHYRLDYKNWITLEHEYYFPHGSLALAIHDAHQVYLDREVYWAKRAENEAFQEEAQAGRDQEIEGELAWKRGIVHYFGRELTMEESLMLIAMTTSSMAAMMKEKQS